MKKMLRKLRNRLILAGIVASIGAVLSNAKTDKELAANKSVLHNKNWRKYMPSVDRILTVTATITKPDTTTDVKGSQNSGKVTGKKSGKKSGKSKK